jgi:hypothetical protein
MCGLENDKYPILILAHEERNKTSRKKQNADFSESFQVEPCKKSI